MTGRSVLRAPLGLVPIGALAPAAGCAGGQYISTGSTCIDTSSASSSALNGRAAFTPTRSALALSIPAVSDSSSSLPGTLREIAAYRGKRDGKKVDFGVYAQVVRPGRVRVGDPIEAS